MKKYNVLAILPSKSPSSVINIIAPLTYIQESGEIDLTIQLEGEVVTPQEVAKIDRIVLCRNSEPVYRPIYELALQLGIPLIYDLDDHLLGIPKGNPTHIYHSIPSRKSQYEWLLQSASLIRVHSSVLKTVVSTYNANVQVRWAPINWTLVPQELPEISYDPVHVVYAAQAISGRKLFPNMLPDIQQLLAKYSDRVRLHFLGFHPQELKGHPSVIFQEFESDYARYFSDFTRFGYAIGLAPMLDDLFHNCKTNVKYRDYAAAGAAGIYANTPLFRDNGVIDGATGLLVSGEPGSWFPAIERLLQDRELLEKIRHNARQDVEQRYRMETVAAQWMEDFASLPEPSPISSEQIEEISKMKWWFTGIKKPDSRILTKLRKYLRENMPPRMKVAYYDLRYSIIRFRREKLKRG